VTIGETINDTIREATDGIILIGETIGIETTETRSAHPQKDKNAILNENLQRVGTIGETILGTTIGATIATTRGTIGVTRDRTQKWREI